MYDKDKIWYEDLRTLYHKERYTEFFPHPNMTLEEKLNSMVRLSIYFAIISAILLRSPTGVYFMMAMMMLSIFMYYNYRDPEQFYIDPSERADGKTYNTSNENELALQPVNPSQARFSAKKKNMAECIRPTRNNPFMNFDIINDLTERPGRAPACNYREVANEVKKEFDYNYYRDVDDCFDSNERAMRFYTMPVTEAVNDQDLFAKALYLSPDGSCKENQLNCSPWPAGDLRYNRSIDLIDPNRNPV